MFYMLIYNIHIAYIHIMTTNYINLVQSKLLISLNKYTYMYTIDIARNYIYITHIH